MTKLEMDNFEFQFGDPRRLFELWQKLTGENLLETPRKAGQEELKKC